MRIYTIHMRFLLSLIVSAWVLCVIGARGFPARVTPSHFGLDSRGTDDRLSALVCCFSKRPGADRIASVRVHAVKFVIAWVCHIFFGLM